MFICRDGQSLSEHADVFIKNFQKMPSGGKDGEALSHYWAEALEPKDPHADVVEAAITNMGGLGYNAYELPILNNTGIKVSSPMLAWFAIQMGANNNCLGTLIGLFALVFYRDHDQNEEMTLDWALNLVGHGKLLNWQMVLGYHMNSQDKNGVYPFETLDRLEFFNNIVR
jgi:hypothetical protein